MGIKDFANKAKDAVKNAVDKIDGEVDEEE